MKRITFFSKKLHFTILMMVLFPVIVFAGNTFVISQELNKSSGEDIKVSGIVQDQDGQPIIGATVMLTGGSKGTITGINGDFNIIVPPGSTLEVSFIGYRTEKVRVSGEKKYKIILNEDTQTLEELVVIGYGTMQKKDLTGTVGSLNMSEITKTTAKSFDDALAGRVAGVHVVTPDGQPGALPDIVIRGGNSITQTNAPLYVIDGFPIEDNDNAAINPNDIESIDILKDASATAIYGARGANGVIMITTKKGEVGDTRVVYNGSVGFSDPVKKIEVMDPYEFVRLQLEINPTGATDLYLTSHNMTLEDYRNVPGTDWYDKVTQQSMTQNHSFSISGGAKSTRFSLSGSYYDQKGLFINTGFKRYQGRITMNHDISKNLKIGINTNYSTSNSYGVVAAESDATNSPASILTDVWGYRPILTTSTDIDLTDEDLLIDPSIDTNTNFRVNPYLQLTNALRERIRENLFANGTIEWRIIPSLTLMVRGGVSKRLYEKNAFNNSNTRSGNTRFANSSGPNGSRELNNSINFSNENTLTYVYKKKKHTLNLLGGYTQQANITDIFGASAIQIPNESLIISGLDEGVPEAITSSLSRWVLLSFLGRVNYNYQSKYYLTASMRADGSSKFVEQNRWAYFPSAALAYRISEERFMKSIDFISNMKLRGSWGLTGNNRIGDFANLSKISINTSYSYPFGNSLPTGSIVSTLGNPSLKWETTQQVDAGLDLGLFKSRIDITMDYYYKRTHDLLLNAEMPQSSGYVRSYKNVGSVSNQGVEFTITTVNVSKGGFEWITNFNISTNKSKVLSLTDGQNEMTTSVAISGTTNNALYIAKVGEPIAQFYGLKYLGTYKYEHFDLLDDGTYLLKDEYPANGFTRENVRPGDAMYQNMNPDEDNTISALDYTVIGDPNPDFIGGLNNSFRYKGVDLGVFFQFSYGNEVYNANRVVFENGREIHSNNNQFASLKNRWSPENPDSDIPAINRNGGNFYSSRMVEDGSYLRLKSVTLGYTLRGPKLKAINIQSIRLYGAADNVYIWTKYSGISPDVSTRSSSPLTPALDYSAYPTSKTISAGIEVKF